MVKPETCDICKQEVRYGFRNGWGWHHREPVDHNTRFGPPAPPPWHMSAEQHEEENTPEPIPEPEQRAVPVDDADLPGGSRLVVSAARKADWTVKATRSRGPSLHSTHWTTLSIQDFLLVRLSRGEDRAVASWITNNKGEWGSDFAWVWNTRGPSLEPVTITELKARLKA